MSKTSFPRTFCVVVDTPCRTYGEWIKEHDAKVRADAIKEYKQSDEYIKECVQRYLKGKADKYQEITSAYMLLTEKQVEDISAEAIEDYTEKSFDLIEKIILKNVKDIPTGLNIYAQIMAGMEKLTEEKKE